MENNLLPIQTINSYKSFETTKNNFMQNDENIINNSNINNNKSLTQIKNINNSMLNIKNNKTLNDNLNNNNSSLSLFPKKKNLKDLITNMFNVSSFIITNHLNNTKNLNLFGSIDYISNNNNQIINNLNKINIDSNNLINGDNNSNKNINLKNYFSNIKNNQNIFNKQKEFYDNYLCQTGKKLYLKNISCTIKLNKKGNLKSKSPKNKKKILENQIENLKKQKEILYKNLQMYSNNKNNNNNNNNSSKKHKIYINKSPDNLNRNKMIKIFTKNKNEDINFFYSNNKMTYDDFVNKMRGSSNQKENEEKKKKI